MDALPELIARLQTRGLALIAFFAGAASVLAMAPFFLWPVMFITFSLLVWTLDSVCFRQSGAEEPLAAFRKRLRHAALIGWAFGFGYFLASIYWIGYAFYVDPERNAALMPFAVAALPAGLALFHAAAAAVAAALWRRGYVRLLALSWAFFCAEAARGYLLTGFPWNLFGEALAASAPYMQMAAYIGVYGLTLAALLIFSAPAALIAAPQARYARQWAPALAAIIALAGSYASGNHRLRQEAGEVEGVRLRIVQPNVPQQERWNPEKSKENFDGIISLSRHGTGGDDISAFTHIIWPESSVPVPFFVLNRDIRRDGDRETLAGLIPAHATLILGAERIQGILSVDDRYRRDRAYNSLFVLTGGAKISKIYDKTHLVPFGEYFPLRDAFSMIGLRAFSHLLNGFDSGQEQAASIDTPHAPGFLPLICYEIIFPGRISNLKMRPGWLVNITNDAWFGDSTGPHQHLHQARIRAVEEGLPVIRAANTGISAVIDPFGRVLAALPLGTTGVIDHGLPRALPVTVYENIRLWLFMFLILFPLLFYLFIVAFGKSE
jgi:apolipoprotein N-acyltransferase